MLVSGISFADDINMFLRNSWDNKSETADAKKTQVLFLIDLPEGGDKQCLGTYKCYEIAADGSRGDLWEGTGDCPTESGGGGGGTACAAGCYQLPQDKFSLNNYWTPYSGGIQMYYNGCFCPDGTEGTEGTDGYWKVEDCTIPGVVDVRPVIEKVMAERPDIKYGVMALNKGGAADMILPVKLRSAAVLAKGATSSDDDGEDRQKLYATTFPTLDNPLDGAAIFPTLGGMQSVEKYLAGEMVGYESPLTDDCKYTQLVVITNGGWKNDVADAEAGLLQLATDLKESVVKNECGARVATSVIGIDVPENDLINYPLFESGDGSVAQTMAENGGGIYKNVHPDLSSQVSEEKQIGSGIYDAVLDVIDFSYEDPTALITPVAPVSISRSHNLDLFYASAFKAHPGVKWSGNLAQGEKSSAPDPLDFNNSSSLSFPDPDTRKIFTICANGKDLCPLAIDTDVGFTAEDIAWLKGESGTTVQDLLGDVIHFRPLPIHYGADTDDIYLFLGSNRGLLHCFNKSGREQWAFLPPQLKPLISALRQGNTAPQWSMVNHFYGVDGAPSTFIYDGNKDGKISSGDDMVMLYYGLRRGGAGYFAMDITTPTAPMLKWTAGSSDLNYGSKPEAEIVSGDQPAEDPEEIPEVAGSGGGCPVFSMYYQSAGQPSGIVIPQGVDGCGASYCLASTKEGLGTFLGHNSVLTFDTIYFRGIENGQPMYTLQNQCIPSISKNDEQYTFDAHPIAMGSALRPNNGGYLGECVAGSGMEESNQLIKGHVGIGKSAAGTPNEAEAIVGFNLMGLPNDITITEARITLAHTGKGDLDQALRIYDDGILVYAAHDGMVGSTPAMDGHSYVNPSSIDDCEDDTYYDDSSIAMIGSPTNGIALGSRTSDGLINLSPEKLTDLFINKRKNDDRNHSWVQFKIKRKETDSNDLILWSRPIEGPAIANYEGDGFWGKTVPRLTLKWEESSGSTDPVLTIKQTGSFGSVEAKLGVFDTSPFDCLDAECSKTYATNDSVTLTATGDDFDKWVGCTVNAFNAKKCSVTMDESKTVTAEYTSIIPNLILDLEGGDGSIKVTYTDGGLTQIYNITADDTLPIPQEKSVSLIPEALDDFESWAGWNGITAACDDTTKECTFTMPANNVSVTANFQDAGSTDTDGDTINDSADNCPDVANTNQENMDGDAYGDACDDDKDGDGTVNSTDNCPDVVNADQADTDSDGIGDACDSLTDSDGDGVADSADNCPNDSNANQTDDDGDGIGNACDTLTDSDNDGVADSVDNCLNDSNADQANMDGDAEGDVCDDDRDGDSTANSSDAFPDDASETSDSDGDGVGDNGDNCPDDSNSDQADDDNNGIGNACDTGGATCTKTPYSPPSGAPGNHVSNCGFSEACAAGDNVKVNYSYYAGTAEVYVNSADGKGYSSDAACSSAN